MTKLMDKYWKVTRSLVSYDDEEDTLYRSVSLKGHQIIGELRLKLAALQKPAMPLKGHQIIGELRHGIYKTL